MAVSGPICHSYMEILPLVGILPAENEQKLRVMVF